MNHERLAELADALIPGEAGMPSASEAGAVGEWLDAVLAARPDFDPLAAVAASPHDVDRSRSATRRAGRRSRQRWSPPTT